MLCRLEEGRLVVFILCEFCGLCMLRFEYGIRCED